MMAPRANPHLIGHDLAEAGMAEAMASARMHHAWLLTGPPGIGKATLAFRFARRLLSGLPADGTLAVPMGHPVFRRVAAASHADLLTVQLEMNTKTNKLRSEIVADDARNVAEFMHYTAAEGGWRVAIVDGAEDLNRHAANSLLKILEEPPSRAILLLVSAAPGRLLPTIRSRCRRLRLSPLEQGDVERVLELASPEMEAGERGRVAAMAEGSPGRAMQLAESGGVGCAELLQKALAALPELGVEQAHAVADALGREDKRFSTFMELLRGAVAGAVRNAGRGRLDPDQARLIGTRPLAAWVDVWHALTRLQDETEGLYLDKRQAIVTGLGMLTTSR